MKSFVVITNIFYTQVAHYFSWIPQMNSMRVINHPFQVFVFIISFLHNLQYRPLLWECKINVNMYRIDITLDADKLSLRRWNSKTKAPCLKKGLVDILKEASFPYWNILATDINQVSFIKKLANLRYFTLYSLFANFTMITYLSVL